MPLAATSTGERAPSFHCSAAANCKKTIALTLTMPTDEWVDRYTRARRDTVANVTGVSVRTLEYGRVCVCVFVLPGGSYSFGVCFGRGLHDRVKRQKIAARGFHGRLSTAEAVRRNALFLSFILFFLSSSTGLVFFCSYDICVWFIKEKKRRDEANILDGVEMLARYFVEREGIKLNELKREMGRNINTTKRKIHAHRTCRKRDAGWRYSWSVRDDFFFHSRKDGHQDAT